MKITEVIIEAANPAQQAAIAISMKKAGKKPKSEGVEGSQKECPPATQDIKLNLKNRQKAIDEYGYGPLNPSMPNNKFWMKKVDEWNLDSVSEAKESLCGNCAAFDVRESTLDCIAQGIDSESPEDAVGVIDAGDLGYCKFLKFKCASRRTCDAWVTGGPLTDKQGVAEDWNKVNKKDKTSGMSRKAVKAYRRENPGSKLQTAVTTKPSKLKPGSKAAKRRKSFCARMSGNKGPMKKPNGKPTPKALALRRWNCESVEQMEELVMLAEQYIRNLKK
jgi:hypothetical protein